MRVLMTGGGTGGHVNPALAIAKIIKTNQPDSEIAFIGTERGIENRLVPREGYQLYHVNIQGIRRSLSPANIKTAYLVLKAPKKANKNQSSSNAVKAVRSLHYIDDEDFEDTRERGLARKAALEEKEKQEKAEAAERAQKLPFGKISLKKDDRKSEQKEEAPAQEEQADDTTNNE